MDVKIGDRWLDVVANAIESGRFTSTDDVVHEGLRLLARQEDAFHQLKEKVERAIERGGEYSSEQVLAHAEAALESWERTRKRAA